MTLSRLAIGSLELSPSFDENVTSYTARTSNATNVINATATDEGASVSITVGDSSVANGSAPTWSDGENVVTVTVTNGSASRDYVVTVTKE